MNAEARKWIERAEAAGEVLAEIVDRKLRDYTTLTFADYAAAGQLFATIARFHLDAEERVVTTLDHFVDANEKVAEGARTVNVRSCSACGGDHDGLTALPLPLGHAWGVGIRWTHAATCPHSRTTVYVSFDDEPAPAPSAEPTPAPRRFGKWVGDVTTEQRCEEIGEMGATLFAWFNGKWFCYPYGDGDVGDVTGQVPEVDPDDPRPILARARAAAEVAAVAAFGPCEFGCES